MRSMLLRACLEETHCSHGRCEDDGGLLVEATAHLKDRLMANYSPPSRKKNYALSNDKLARAVAALGQALKDSKNRAE